VGFVPRPLGPPFLLRCVSGWSSGCQVLQDDGDRGCYLGCPVPGRGEAQPQKSALPRGQAFRSAGYIRYPQSSFVSPPLSWPVQFEHRHPVSSSQPWPPATPERFCAKSNAAGWEPRRPVSSRRRIRSSHRARGGDAWFQVSDSPVWRLWRSRVNRCPPTSCGTRSWAPGWGAFPCGRSPAFLAFPYDRRSSLPVLSSTSPTLLVPCAPTPVFLFRFPYPFRP